jgi:hypothetical protein
LASSTIICDSGRVVRRRIIVRGDVILGSLDEIVVAVGDPIKGEVVAAVDGIGGVDDRRGEGTMEVGGWLLDPGVLGPIGGDRT